MMPSLAQNQRVIRVFGNVGLVPVLPSPRLLKTLVPNQFPWLSLPSK